MSNSSISSHLNEYVHVFKNGTTARLYVEGWNRNTVADGNWLNINTIRPLSSRDVYLAECIDELSSNNVVYYPGKGIKITDINGYNVSSTNQLGPYTISVDDSVEYEKYKFNIPLSSETNYTTKETTVGIKIDNKTIQLNENNELNANIDELIDLSLQASSMSSISSYKEQNFYYTYNSGTLDFVITSAFPISIEDEKLYLIG